MNEKITDKATGMFEKATGYVFLRSVFAASGPSFMLPLLVFYDCCEDNS